MDAEDFRKKKEWIDALAGKYKWSAVSNDPECGRLSYTDDLAIYKLDIYTTKMTVCIHPKGGKNVYLKRQSRAMVEKVFKNPYRY